MKIMKRFMAALLAVAIMVAVMPAMPTEAATKPSVKGAKFVQWVDYLDQTKCYVGVPAGQKVDRFEYKVFDMNGVKLLRQGSQTGYYTTTDGKYECLKVTGTRKTTCSTIRVRVKKNNVWSNWSGLIAIIPIHTKNNVSLSLNANAKTATIKWDNFTGFTDYVVFLSRTGKGGWWRAATKSGTSSKLSVTISKFNGKPFVNNQNYYYKVVGRKKLNGTYVLAKGNRDDYAIGYFWFYVTYK